MMPTRGKEREEMMREASLLMNETAREERLSTQVTEGEQDQKKGKEEKTEQE